jgi:hypothetical protein
VAPFVRQVAGDRRDLRALGYEDEILVSLIPKLADRVSCPEGQLLKLLRLGGLDDVGWIGLRFGPSVLG